MIARVLFVLAAGVGLSACQPAVPDSGAPNIGRGVGFDSAAQAQQAQRNAALARSTAVPAPTPVSSTPLSGSAQETAAETQRVLAATSSNGTNGVGTTAATNSGVAPVDASPSNPAPALVNDAGISQENNFDAVSARRSIESDAQRIDANAAQYRIVQPEALPSRTATGPNVVEYALANTHPVGTAKYRRSAFSSQSRAARKCAQFPRPVMAQIAFLEAGGPKRDRAGLDPDGDGYACSWDPAPFRKANQVQAAPQAPIIQAATQAGPPPISSE